ncbi:hypothetical protein C8Q70DRAFT_435512 [Cubamyces menziesii]|uniref:Uncharacterized protein n=1 Tax=Trametes cubensis TaxID=1111947 RepID=A0AAD7XAP4_9APHY|nr:hypothetical protein C8Q70DRAFT_435512 [Cubamyces menziesii]KAJ8474933.1 hypothetical protein ONZ51_g6889 [Trametes cubensis]
MHRSKYSCFLVTAQETGGDVSELEAEVMEVQTQDCETAAADPGHHSDNGTHNDVLPMRPVLSGDPCSPSPFLLSSSTWCALSEHSEDNAKKNTMSNTALVVGQGRVGGDLTKDSSRAVPPLPILSIYLHIFSSTSTILRSSHPVYRYTRHSRK